MKSPAHVGLTMFMRGEWNITKLKEYIELGIVAAPSRKSVDEMVETGTHIVDVRGESREFQFTEAMRDKLIKEGVISQRAAPSATKREFVSKEHKEMYDLFQKAKARIGNFIKNDEIVQAVANLKWKAPYDFQDFKEGDEFAVVPSYYLMHTNAALDTFEQQVEA